MTLLYGRPIELIYAMGASGSPLANSAVRTLLSQPASGSVSATCYWPPNTINPASGVGQAFKIIAKGHVSTPGAGVPTLTVSVTNDTTAGTFNAALASTAALTLSTSLSAASFTMEIDCTVQGTGTSGTMMCEGYFEYGPFASSTALSRYAVGSGTAATVNTTVSNFIEVWGQWGSAVAGTTITLDQLLVFGWN